MPTKATTTDQSKSLIAAVESVRALVSESLKATRDTYADMKADFNEKHKENIDVRNNLQGKVDDLGSRVLLVESTLRTVVGDNTGESGLLHEVKKGQEQLKDGLNDAREEFRRGLAAITSDVREIRTTTSSAPSTRDWMNKWIGVGAAIGIASAVALIITALVEVLRHGR